MFIVHFIVLLTSVQTQAAQQNSDVLEPPPLHDFREELSDLQLLIRKESLSIREEMFTILGGGSLAESYLLETVKELANEVRQFQQLIRDIASNQELSLARLTEVRTNQDTAAGQLNEVRTNQDTVAGQLNEVQANQDTVAGQLNEVQANEERILEETARCTEMIDLARSEVRLISQHKRTWQNSTHSGGYHPDFAVDGVYTRESSQATNPIAHTASSSDRNQVLMIDLGERFKIHTIKVWNRFDMNDNMLGVYVYADETLVGGVAENQLLYNFDVRDGVFARKVYLKQSRANYLNALEVQVFGTGPYGEDEML